MAKVRLSRREAERGLLPQVCALTGVPTEDVKRKQFWWMPSWVYLTLLAGLLPYVIVALLVRKSMTVELPLIRGKHAHWLVRQLFALLGILGTLVLFFVGVVLSTDTRNGGQNETLGVVLMAAGGIGFLVVLFGAIIFNATAIRPVEITDSHITLAGVHEEFVRALEEERERDEEEYEEAMRDWRAKKRERNGDGDEDRRPPRARRSRREED
ncbi:MAG: hypothetical protein ABGY75_20180 [Gemmataceae bacterium]